MTGSGDPLRAHAVLFLAEHSVLQLVAAVVVDERVEAARARSVCDDGCEWGAGLHVG